MSESTHNICPEYFSVPETVQHLKISRCYLYQLIAENKIRPFKLGRRTFFAADELRRFAETVQRSR